METFDLPDNSVSCARRETSIVAPQALTLLNGVQVVEAAESLARIVGCAEADRKLQIQMIFRSCFLRDAAERELEVAEVFLASHSLEELCRALLNANEFAFID